jgi:hypothetical protein
LLYDAEGPTFRETAAMPCQTARRTLACVALLAPVLLSSLGQADEAAGTHPLPAARKVTLQAEKSPLSKVLAELTRQTRIRVEDRSGEPDIPVTIHLEGVSFWQAIDALASAAGRRVYLSPRSNRILLDTRPPGYRPPPVSYDGPFRCAVKRVSAARDLESGRDLYKAAIEVAWEPGLQPLFLETRPTDLRVQDERKQSLPVPQESGSAPAPVYGRTSLVLDVPLPSVPRSVPRLGLLAGGLTVIAPSKMLTFDLGPLDKLAAARSGTPPRRQEQDGVVCRVSELVLAKDRWTVQITLDLAPGGKQLDSYQSWVVNNELVLEAKDGRRLTTNEYAVEKADGGRHAVVSYHFTDRSVRGKPEDWKVIYRTPASIVEMPVKFSFTDVPLP